jgi:hypothetical protein
LYTYHHDVGKPVMEYVHGVLTLASQLRAIGVELGKEDVLDILIYSLAPEFSAVVTVLMQRAGSFTIEDISVVLVEEESHLKGRKEGTSYSALKAKVEKNLKRSLTCYRCNEKGHIAQYCPALVPKPADSSSVDSSSSGCSDGKAIAHAAHTAIVEERAIQLF